MNLLNAGIFLISLSLFLFTCYRLYQAYKFYSFTNKKRKALDKVMTRANLYNDFCLCHYCVHCTRVTNKEKISTLTAKCKTFKEIPNYTNVRYCNEFELDVNKISLD